MTDPRMTDMNAWCRNDHQGYRPCDGTLREGFTGCHWHCICPCHPDAPRTGDNPGFPEAYEQWAKARAELERGQR